MALLIDWGQKEWAFTLQLLDSLRGWNDTKDIWFWVLGYMRWLAFFRLSTAWGSIMDCAAMLYLRWALSTRALKVKAFGRNGRTTGSHSIGNEIESSRDTNSYRYLASACEAISSWNATGLLRMSDACSLAIFSRKSWACPNAPEYSSIVSLADALRCSRAAKDDAALTFSNRSNRFLAAPARVTSSWLVSELSTQVVVFRFWLTMH